MRADSIVFGISGVLVGVIIGWVLGSQQARGGRVATAPPAAQSQPAGQTAQTGSRAVPVDPERAKALESVAQQNPKDVQPRVQLGNLYFDAEQYPQAISWYEQAFALNNRDANVSTDLGVAYYYTNQPDRAIKQFEHSLSLDPKHLKTLLNMGIVRAFGKQDLEGAQAAWQQVIDLSPNSSEGQAAKRALDSMRSAHQNAGAGRGAGG